MFILRVNYNRSASDTFQVLGVFPTREETELFRKNESNSWHEDVQWKIEEEDFEQEQHKKKVADFIRPTIIHDLPQPPHRHLTNDEVRVENLRKQVEQEGKRRNKQIRGLRFYNEGQLKTKLFELKFANKIPSPEVINNAALYCSQQFGVDFREFNTLTYLEMFERVKGILQEKGQM